VTWLVGALLALAAVLAPVPLDGPVPWYVQVPATAALAVAGGVALTRARLRTAVAVLLVGWVVLLIAVGSGPVGTVAVLSGVALRCWAGVPELARLGRAAVPHLAADLVGGAAVAALVLAVAQHADPLRPTALVLTLAAAGALFAAAALRLRR